MKIEDLFKAQIDMNHPVTEDMLFGFTDSTYFNKEPVELGDVVLFAFLIQSYCDDTDTEIDSLLFIKLNERHLPLFDVGVPAFRNNNIDAYSVPVIKRKVENDKAL